MFVQTIVCFASSRKDGRRCVAGKTWSRAGNGAWVRPVNSDPSRALPPAMLAYQDGAQPGLLDIVQVPLETALPEGHQQENALMSLDYYWAKTGQLSWDDVGPWLDAPSQLWSNNDQSGGMINSRVSAVVRPVLRRCAWRHQVACIRILPTCEMDVLPPRELVASIRHWRIPGDLLDVVPPMFVRAAWKACRRHSSVRTRRKMA